MSAVESNGVQGAPVSLKAQYYKYLEALCSSNGIDITTLKNGTSKVDTLEMFFGGLPALIGLKYFDKLRVLCLMGQDIASLSPLSDVAKSLEELWICEGSLKDLTGLEICKQLRRLYLYDCAIENGYPISQLTSLDVLWIQNNRLRSMEFLDSLQFLTVCFIRLSRTEMFKALKCGGEQFSDPVATSIEKWPTKLQHLDIDGNCLTSFKPLLGVSSCEVVRYFDLCSAKYAPSRLIRDDRQMAWIAYSFPFLEELNGDAVTDKFNVVNTTIAETALFDEINRSTKAEREFWHKKALIEKNSKNIGDKLNSFIAALEKASVTTKREGRKELAIALQEQNQLKLKHLKKVKAAMMKHEHALFYFSGYLLPSWRLEGAYQSPVREFNKRELQNLEEVLQTFCLKSDDPKIKVRYALTFVVSAEDVDRSDMEKWFHVKPNTAAKLWDLQEVVELCDRRLSHDYCAEMKLFKNLIPLCNNAQSMEICILAPLVRINSTIDQVVGTDVKLTYDSQEEDKIVEWSNVELTAICLIEFQRTTQCQFDELSSWTVFEEKFNEQIKKLKEVGVDVKLEKTSAFQTIETEEEEEEEREENPDTLATTTENRREGNIADHFDRTLAACRWRTQTPIWNGRQLSLRNPLELTIAYSRALSPSSFEKTTVTCLNLSNLNIGKLDGIENLVNLHCLNLADNKLTSVKKLRTLKRLTFLDISGNNVNKIEDLSPLITELNASRNGLTCLGFCNKLQLITRLNVARNKLKSLKGIEQSKLLKIIIASDNAIKMANNEIEIFANVPKLSMIDLCGNPVAESEEYRKRLLCMVPGLLAIDFEKVPPEERSRVARKSGKVLTLEFIEKLVPDLESQTVLDLSENCFQMIALDRNSTWKLQHITELNMANNSLEHVYELVDLKYLKKLNLAHNQIVSLCNTDFVASPDTEILPELEDLDLSFNNLNCQGLARIGLEMLPGLKRLMLIGNQLARFDSAQFDFPNLEEVDVSQNEIRLIRKKTLSHLLSLNMADNKLKELDGLEVPKIQFLNLSNNRIGSCAALKNLKQMKELKILNCSGNPVTERRVYHDFIIGTLKNLEELDSVAQPSRYQEIPSNSSSTQKTRADIEIQSAASLPPQIKLANAKSSDVKRYDNLKQGTRSVDYIPEDIFDRTVVTGVVQIQPPIQPTIKDPRSQSVGMNFIPPPPRLTPFLGSNFILVGATKHHRH